MAVVADYLILDRVIYGLRAGSTGASPRADVSLNFSLPSGTTLALGQQGPLLHYEVMQVLTTGDQLGIAVEVNGTEVHREWFHAGSRRVLVEAILQIGPPAIPSRAPHSHIQLPAHHPFRLNAVNTMRFLPVNATNDPDHAIYFGKPVLWLQRDSSAAGNV